MRLRKEPALLPLWVFFGLFHAQMALYAVRAEFFMGTFNLGLSGIFRPKLSAKKFLDTTTS